MSAHSPLPHVRRQHGAVLLIGMVMLLMLTLIAVGVIRLSTRHTQVVNNEQVRTEAVTAANYALDKVLNQPYDKPTWDTYRGTTGATVNVNLGTSQAADNTDPTVTTGTVPVKVKKLTCKRGRVLKNSELFDANGQITNAYDKTCVYQAPNPGLTFGNSTSADKSLCGTALWEVTAEADTQAAGGGTLLAASVPVVQGVEVRVLSSEVDTTCN